MAIWQFDIRMLPSEAVLRRHGVTAVIIPKNEIDDEEALWENLPISANFEDEISEILPRMQSWHRELRQWGCDDGDRIDLWTDGKAISGIKVRIDVRQISRIFIVKVLELARRHHWLIRTEDGQVFQPSFAKLLSAIHTSDAFRFVENPQRFLEELSNEQENDTESDSSK